MSGPSRRDKQLDKELLALGEDAMLLDEFDGFTSTNGDLPTTSRFKASIQGPTRLPVKRSAATTHARAAPARNTRNAAGSTEQDRRPSPFLTASPDV